MIKSLASLFLICSICACTTNKQSLNTPSSTPDRIGKAIVSPLNDINLVQDNIPQIITDALKNPYQVPGDRTCAGLSEQVQKLDFALGADLDAKVAGNDKNLAEKGSALAQDETVNTVERTISGAIPFRSWIRKFSGAEKHSKEMAAAIAAGIVRRAFLKGIGQEHGCEYPAAPLKSASTPAATATVSK